MDVIPGCVRPQMTVPAANPFQTRDCGGTQWFFEMRLRPPAAGAALRRSWSGYFTSSVLTPAVTAAALT